MAGYGSKILTSAGYAIEATDVQQLADLLARRLMDEMLYNMGACNDFVDDGNGTVMIQRANAASMRTLGRALCARAQTSNNITLDGGLVMQTIGTELDDTAVAPETLCTYVEPLTIAMGAAPGADHRRDLVQARLVNQNESTVSRDFQDAATRALSTSSVVVRSNVVLETSIKTGSTQASAAAADTLAAEPTPDAGYFKLFSISRSTGDTDLDQKRIWDWRKPMGIGHRRTRSVDCLYNNNAGTFVFQNTDIISSSTANANDFFAFCPMKGANGGAHLVYGKNTNGSADGRLRFEDHRRMIALNYYGAVKSVYANMWMGYEGIGGSGPPTEESWSPDWLTQMVSTSDSMIYTADDANFTSQDFNDLPIWANGHATPVWEGSTATGSQASDDELMVWFDPTTGQAVSFRGADCFWWGGL